MFFLTPNQGYTIDLRIDKMDSVLNVHSWYPCCFGHWYFIFEFTFPKLYVVTIASLTFEKVTLNDQESMKCYSFLSELGRDVDSKQHIGEVI